MESLPLSFSNIDALLFNETNGACVKLISMSPENLTDFINHFKIIDDVWSNSLNIRSDELIKVKEKFISWGCKLIIKLIRANKFFKEADSILDYMGLILKVLPSESVCHKSQFDKKSLFLIFNEFNCYNDESPLLLVKILTKICQFCEKEFSNTFLVCKIMHRMLGLILDAEYYPFLEELYRYCGIVLRLHCNSLEDKKLEDESVIKSMKNIINIRNLTEQHEVAIIHFWWQLICSLKTESIHLIDQIDIITFLSYIFGKYLTLNPKKEFDYELSSFSCFTNRDTLGPLCNHVMSQILVSIYGSPPQFFYMIEKNLEDWRASLPVTSYTNDTFGKINMDLFKGNYLITVHLESILLAFGYWVQFCDPIIDKTPFRLLRIVFNCLWKRFLTEDESNEPNRLVIKQEPVTLNPCLWKLMEMSISMKNIIESNLNRTSELAFGDHCNFISVMLKSMTAIEENLRLGPEWRRVTKIMLTDSLRSMGRLLLRPATDCKVILIEQYNMWLNSCMVLLTHMWPVSGGPGARTVCEELGEMMVVWCESVLEDHVIASIHSKNLWHTSIRWWVAMATDLKVIVDSQSFSLDFVTDVSQLAPFVNFIVVPTVFLQQCDAYTLMMEDYLYVREQYEHLFKVVSSKIEVLGPVVAGDWYSNVCKSILNCLCNVDADSYSTKIVLLNFCTRMVDLIVSRCPPLTSGNMDQYKRGPLWQCTLVLGQIVDMFTSDNIRLSFKGTQSKKRLFSLDDEAVADWDCDFTMGLVMSASDNILVRLARNDAIVKATMKLLLPQMSSVAQIFFQDKEQQMTKAGWKNIPQLHKEGQKIEDMFVSLLKHIEISNRGTNIFPIVKPILQALFSILNDQIVSQSTIEFALNYYTENIVANEHKYDNKFSDEFMAQLDNVKVFYPKLIVSVLEKVKPGRKSQINNQNGDIVEEGLVNPLKRKKSKLDETVNVSLKRKKSISRDEPVNGLSDALQSPKYKRKTLTDIPIIDKKSRLLSHNEATISRLVTETKTKRKYTKHNSDSLKYLDDFFASGDKSDQVHTKRTRNSLPIPSEIDDSPSKIVQGKVGRGANKCRSMSVAGDNQGPIDSGYTNGDKMEKSKVVGSEKSRQSQENADRKIIKLPRGRGRWKNHIPKSNRPSGKKGKLQHEKDKEVVVVSSPVKQKQSIKDGSLSNERFEVIIHDIVKFSPAKEMSKVTSVPQTTGSMTACDDCIIVTNDDDEGARVRTGGAANSPLVIGRTFSMAHKDPPPAVSPQKVTPRQDDSRLSYMKSDHKRENQVSFTEPIVNQSSKEEIMMREDNAGDTKDRYRSSLFDRFNMCTPAASGGDRTNGYRRVSDVSDSWRVCDVSGNKRVSLCQDFLPNTTRELETFKEALLVVKEGLRVGSLERFRETVRFLFDRD